MSAWFHSRSGHLEMDLPTLHHEVRPRNLSVSSVNTSFSIVLPLLRNFFFSAAPLVRKQKFIEQIIEIFIKSSSLRYCRLGAFSKIGSFEITIIFTCMGEESPLWELKPIDMS